LERLIKWEKHFEVGPAQLLRQCSNNLVFKEGLHKFDHVAQILGWNSGSKLVDQLPRQRRDNLFSVFGALILKGFLLYPLSSEPVKNDDSSIDTDLIGCSVGDFRG